MRHFSGCFDDNMGCPLLGRAELIDRRTQRGNLNQPERLSEHERIFRAATDLCRASDQMHHLTMVDRILVGLVAAYFAYRLWSGWGDGVIYGDGDDDVRADEHPMAFVLTALSVVMVIGICLFIALGSSVGDIAALIAWLWKV
jgi:hypothetical protein